MTSPVRIHGTPRSVREMEFVADLDGCASCGARAEVDWVVGHDPDAWSISGTCESCGAARLYRFDDATLVEPEPASYALGSGASTVLDRDALTREIDRITPLVVPEPDEKQVAIHRRYAARVITALFELEKLGPDTEGIAKQREHWLRIAEAMGPRPLPTVEDASKESGTRADALDGPALVAHREWLDRARSGSGRLEINGLVAQLYRLVGSNLTAAGLGNVDFRFADLRRSDWSEAHIDSCWLDESRVQGSSFERSTISLSGFGGAQAGGCRFVEATLDGTDFSEADLRDSDWSRAVANDCEFTDANLDNARMFGARFIDCVFFGASVRGSLSGATFEKCDFRSVDFTGMHLAQMTFIDCRFEDAIGMEPPVASRGNIAQMSEAMSPLLRLSRVFEERGVPIMPALKAAELAGENNIFLGVSAFFPRVYMLLPYRAELLATVAPSAVVGALPARPMLKLYIEGDKMDVSLVAVGTVPPNEAVDVAPAAARAAWLDIVAKMSAVANGRVVSRMRYLTQERGTIAMFYESRATDADARFVTSMDQLAWSLGVSRAHRERWKQTHPALRGGLVTVTTACTTEGPAPELAFLYREAGWDDAVELCKLVASPEMARVGAAMFGTVSGTLQLREMEGAELVLSAGAPDVVAWTLPRVR